MTDKKECGEIRARLPPQTEAVSDTQHAAASVTRPPDRLYVQKPVSALPKLCVSVTWTLAQDMHDAALRRSSQETASNLLQTCQSVTATMVVDRFGAVIGRDEAA